jgi:hypothetical protein
MVRTSRDIDQEINDAIIVNNELHRERDRILREHNTYRYKKSFFPHKMNQWEEEIREINASYRVKIDQTLIELKMLNKELKEQLEKEEAAEGLLRLKRSYENKQKNIKIKQERSNIEPRRSKRIIVRQNKE